MEFDKPNLNFYFIFVVVVFIAKVESVNSVILINTNTKSDQRFV